MNTRKSKISFAVIALSLLSVTLAGTVWGQEEAVSPRQQLREDILAEVAQLEAHGNLLKKVCRYVRPSVVHIEARKKEGESLAYGGNVVDEAGSGVIIRHHDKNYVLTNRHVISQAANQDIKIHLDDGRILRPSQVWTDRETDVAVMAISADRLIPGQIGDSSTVEIGEFVLAVGSPFGLSQSVTYGIISAKGRRDLQLGRQGLKFQNFMQTDAAINPGNSGGPLLNLRGEVIGINTAIASNSGGNDGIGFTIPINSALNIARQMIDDGKVSRAFLGVVLDSQYDSKVAEKLGLPMAKGTRVNGVTPDSPAAEAGILVGDVIIRFNNQEIDDDSHLVNVVSLSPLNIKLPVELYRGGVLTVVKLELAVRDATLKP
ncbi:S1C family serine protease [Blastopirellula marina]|uniref:Probable serine protease do-like (Precursor) n=1 Tax=Blastopirellula marina DSM 3645 TaxID=314230 RepID=A3ZQT3_9BACT|nr:trypsin-like peptidase domain-containing protein [Blastopirellula marina]EAQ81023.1 probable serine protease do-like (precursor) [Blastopirellula marina DSM 3645]